jgi:hypothetical protein
MAALNGVKASYHEVNAWLNDEVQALYTRFPDGSSDFNNAFGRLHAQWLTAGPLGEYRFSQMVVTNRYTLPENARRTIIQFQRQYNFLEPRGSSGQGRYEEIYHQLGITTTESGALPAFLKLCRLKVDGFVKNNGIKWRKMEVVKETAAGLAWKPWTDSWLEPLWDGSISPPVCRTCGCRCSIELGKTGAMPDFRSSPSAEFQDWISAMQELVKHGQVLLERATIYPELTKSSSTCSSNAYESSHCKRVLENQEGSPEKKQRVV